MQRTHTCKATANARIPLLAGPPGAARENMYDAVSLLPAGPTAVRAEEIVGDFNEYLENM